jgi:hypothetical protein
VIHPVGKNYDQFKSKLKKMLNDGDSHVHGVCILENDWFAKSKSICETGCSIMRKR